MNEQIEFYAKDRAQWRDWLNKNHQIQKEVWLIFYKKSANQPSVSYNEAVEEALCFGWIDSLKKSMDERRYKQKFTPRQATSIWSDSNKKRVKSLIEKGLMTNAGLELVIQAQKNGYWDQVPASQKSILPPEEFMDALHDHPQAKSFFDSLAPSYQKQFLGWIASAKKKETREKRSLESIKRLENHQKLGLK